jgi:hypothetical protein
MYFDKEILLADIIGKTIGALEVSEDKRELKFACTDGSVYLMKHDQDCCESVEIDDIVGELDDLIGIPLLKAEAVSSDEDPSIDDKSRDYYDSHTWTFYHFATIKGYVTIKWLGESNGYYSEDVSFYKL